MIIDKIDNTSYKKLFLIGNHCLVPLGVQEKIVSFAKDPREQKSLLKVYQGILSSCLRSSIRKEVEVSKDFVESAAKSWNIKTDNGTVSKHRKQLEQLGLIQVDWDHWSWRSDLKEGERNYAYAYKVPDFSGEEMELCYIGNPIVPKVKRQPKLKSKSIERHARTFLEGIRIDHNKISDILSTLGLKQAAAVQNAVLRFVKKDYGIVRDSSVNRLHSVLTNTSRILRPCLDHKGETIVGFDLAEAHPTFLANSVNDEKFLDAICESERGFYWMVADSIGCPSRTDVKHRFMAYLYDKNREKSKITKFMFKEFPKTAQYVWDYKKNNGYRAFSISQMRYESELFIDGAYAEAVSQGIPSITIHDSLLSSEQNEKKIKEILTKELDKKGLRYRLSKEVWV